MAQAACPPKTFTTADGLLVTTSISADSDVFKRFFEGYDKAFVLPNEKEDEEGFRRCFELNFGEDYARLSEFYGPYSEGCLIAEDGAVQIGGANFIAIPIDERTISANLNYIYVNADARGKGAFSRLVASVRETLNLLYPGRERILIFIEQNDPFRMSAEDYRRDSEFTGLDQFDRLRIWARRGARVVDFGYAQPPLSADQDADDTLAYSVLGVGDDGLEACVFEAHLRRFFGVSVLKGADLSGNAAAAEQLAIVRRLCAANERIAVLDPTAVLEKLHRPDDISRLWREKPRDLLSALRIPMST